MTSTNRHRILVLGGGYAGTVAAARAAAGARGAEVTLVDARPAFVQRIRMHELLAGSEPQVLPYADLGRRGVRFRQGIIEGLDIGAGWVEVRDAAGARQRVGYDTLLLALGSRTSAPVSGVAEHAVRLNDPSEVRAAAGRLRAAGAGERIVVVGGGLTGIEAATELAERYPLARVSLLSGGRFGREFSNAGEAHLRRALGELNVELREHSTVVGVERSRIHLANGTVVPFGTCVWAGGFEAPTTARDAGLPVLHDGRAIVDATLRVAGQDNVYAAGDAAAVRIDGEQLRMGCVAAGPLGAHAGTNVARLLQGQPLRPFAFAFMVRCISLGRRDGLVQLTSGHDRPKPQVMRRKVAASVKELICRLTFWNVLLEARGVRSSWWPQPRPQLRTERTEELPVAH